MSQAKAHLYLGEMFMKGEGMKQDYVKAREHLLIAAHQELDMTVSGYI